MTNIPGRWWQSKDVFGWMKPGRRDGRQTGPTGKVTGVLQRLMVLPSDGACFFLLEGSSAAGMSSARGGVRLLTAGCQVLCGPVSFLFTFPARVRSSESHWKLSVFTRTWRGVRNTDFCPPRQERQRQALLGFSAASLYWKRGPPIFPSGEEQTQPKRSQTLGSPLLGPLFRILLRTNIFYISFNFFFLSFTKWRACP